MVKAKRTAAQRFAGKGPAIRARFSYDPMKGQLTYLQDAIWGGRVLHPAGSIVKGKINSEGYHCVCVFGAWELTHVIAWFLKTGRWPKRQIDHRNTVRTDNRWCNLRLANQAQQTSNSNRRSDNCSGHKGIGTETRFGSVKYRVRITHNGKRQFLGQFSSLDEAVKVRNAAAMRLHGKFFREG